MLTRVAARAELRFRAALICGPALRREASAFDARVSSSSSGNARPLRSIAVLPLELGRRRAEPRNHFGRKLNDRQPATTQKKATSLFVEKMRPTGRK